MVPGLLGQAVHLGGDHDHVIHVGQLAEDDVDEAGAQVVVPAEREHDHLPELSRRSVAVDESLGLAEAPCLAGIHPYARCLEAPLGPEHH